MTPRQSNTPISKLQKTLAAWGVTTAMVLAGAVFAMKTTKAAVIDPYIRQVASCQFDTLHKPFTRKLEDMEYDSKLVRNILEIVFPDSVVRKAKGMTDNTVWKTK